jgi:3-oxoacyl-[acyl-carrier protein] reductase
MRLAGKTAIVTGAASGFGAGIALKFIAEGAKVLVADINRDAADDTSKTLGTNAISCYVDVGNAASVSTMAKIAIEEFKTLDIIVNNAGVTHLPTPMEDVTENDFDRVMNVNMKSIYYMARSFVPHMKEKKSGNILNISSTAGLSPRPKLNWYNASKGWVNTATKTMAVELAPFGVRVNALNPVAGETPLLASFMGEDTPERRAAFLSTIPLGRFSTPEDMANAATYLCSDEAGMITGVCMEVDGGRCI